MSSPSAPDQIAPHTLFYYVFRLHHLSGGWLDARLRATGVKASQYSVLDLLHRSGPSFSSELARVIGISPQASGAFLRRLEAKGLIARAPHPTSRKTFLLSLTPEGRKVHTRCTELIRAAEAEILADMPKDQADALRTGLATVLGRAQSINGG